MHPHGPGSDAAQRLDTFYSAPSVFRINSILSATAVLGSPHPNADIVITYHALAIMTPLGMHYAFRSVRLPPAGPVRKSACAGDVKLHTLTTLWPCQGRAALRIAPPGEAPRSSGGCARHRQNQTGSRVPTPLGYRAYRMCPRLQREYYVLPQAG